MTDIEITPAEQLLLKKANMPEALFKDLKNLMSGQFDNEFDEELSKALADTEKWKTFAEKYKIDYQSLEKFDKTELDNTQIKHFNSPEEVDAYLMEIGKIKKEEE